MLENSENTDNKPESHAEPDETAPILERSKGLHGEEEENQVSEKQEKFDARAVRGSRGMEEPLAENKYGEDSERR
jgi:hypothetical protein